MKNHQFMILQYIEQEADGFLISELELLLEKQVARRTVQRGFEK